MREIIGNRPIDKFEQNMIRYRDLETNEEYFELQFLYRPEKSNDILDAIVKVPINKDLAKLFIEYSFSCTYKARDKRWEIGFFRNTYNSNSRVNIQDILGYVGKIRRDVDPYNRENVVYFDICKQMKCSLKGREAK